MLVQDESDGSSTKDVKSVDTAESLWSRYFHSRSLEDRNRLVLFYAPLVRVVANRVARRMHSFQSIQELCSCGQFGLINAVERFDPIGGFQFATYATIRIQGAIIDELRRDDMLPKRMRARVREYQVTREALEMELRRTPTFGEMAKHLGTTLAEIVELDDLATISNYMVPLSLIDDGQSGLSPSTWINPNESTDLASMHEEVKAALLRITERQRQVLVLHFLEGFQKSEIADTLGIDRSRVTQLLHQGLRNLRTELGRSPQV